MKEKKEHDYMFYIPTDTVKVLKDFIEKIAIYRFDKRKKMEKRIDWKYKSKYVVNPTLAFNKLSPFSKEDQNKDKYLSWIVTLCASKEIKEIQNLLKKRSEKQIEEMERLGWKSQEFAGQVNGRMIIGLGAIHPQETSMTFHHTYGIPYIPGTAIKGVTRHWVIFEKFGQDERQAEEDSQFKRIFGIQEKSGEIIFLDAFPISSIHLKIDVINPHYPDYYDKGNPPTDWQNPRPVKFLTVEETWFQFYLLGKDQKLLNNSVESLKQALQNFGIGSKTAVGYGYFDLTGP